MSAEPTDRADWLRWAARDPDLAPYAPGLNASADEIDYLRALLANPAVAAGVASGEVTT